MAATLVTYLGWSKEQTIPPLCLELILRSGRSYWIAYIFRFEPDAPMITMRIWDMRAFTDADTQALMATLNAPHDRRAPDYAAKLHRKLEQANIRVAPGDIEALIEWHDRTWPAELKQEIEKQIEAEGFRQP
jgi:hypothetical protein